MQLTDFYNNMAFFPSLLFLEAWCLWLCKIEGKEPITVKKNLTAFVWKWFRNLHSFISSFK